MKIKSLIIVMMFIMSTLIVGCIKVPVSEKEVVISSFEDCEAAGYPIMESYPRQCRVGSKFFVEEIDELKPIGGDKDNKGCLAPAGFTYDEYVMACIRDWELDTDEKREAAKIAADSIGLERGLTIVDVEKYDCEGCYNITINKAERRILVEIEGMRLKE